MSDEANAAAVERLVQAYNAGDLEGFLGCFGPEPKIHCFPDTLAFDGVEAIREEYGRQFQKGYRSEVSDRVVVGRHVAERERVSMGEGSGTTDFLTIYTVEDGKIARVDFLGAEVAAPS